ncbi:MAG TPA: MarR family winged helix-turn-helix transcriptional regulator [Actinoplanes sp.]
MKVLTLGPTGAGPVVLFAAGAGGDPERHRPLHTDTGLSPGDYAVLLTLSEATDHRVRSSELAARIGWERSRLSHHLGRMQRRQLIRREECATDSRGADVVLEPAGAEAFHAATVPHLRAIRELFVDALTADQLAAAGEIAAALQAHLSRPAATRRPESPIHTASAGTGSPTRHGTALRRTSTGHADTDGDSRWN